MLSLGVRTMSDIHFLLYALKSSKKKKTKTFFHLMQISVDSINESNIYSVPSGTVNPVGFGPEALENPNSTLYQLCHFGQITSKVN